MPPLGGHPAPGPDVYTSVWAHVCARRCVGPGCVSVGPNETTALPPGRGNALGKPERSLGVTVAGTRAPGPDPSWKNTAEAMSWQVREAALWLSGQPGAAVLPRRSLSP